jgi:pyruvate/2-oxoglutarate dehydrogenase complex dihydrolipoamide dehydrogenase (E3) component
MIGGYLEFRESIMPQAERYDMLVLGSGEGGKFLAWHMAKSGRRSAVVERKLIGGSCPNTNCLPSKNEIWSAKVADLVHHADRFGMATGPVAVDMAKVLRRKRDMVDGLIAMHLDLYKSSGAELIMGTGRFIAPKTIEVGLNDGGTRVLTGDRVVLNLGTHATIPDIPGLADMSRVGPENPSASCVSRRCRSLPCCDRGRRQKRAAS